MIERRDFLLISGASLLGSGVTGCERVKTFLQPPVSRAAIDIHTHFFNGRDVPVVGFLKQAILREPHRPVDPDILSDAFLKLLKTILLINTPSASRELARLGGGVAPLSETAALQRDERNVATAIARFSRDGGGQARGLTTTRSAESRILDRIAMEVNATGLRQSLQTPEAQGRALSARIYDRGGRAALTTGKKRNYVYRSPLMQTIRWAGLLTRSRVDILAELDRLFGGPGLIRVFSPSIVDFEKWFLTRERTSPLADQVELVAAIARRHHKSLILPFVPFCPLRAALEQEDRPGSDALRLVKHAVMDLGFMGVKLYPPMGFRPIGNRSDLSWVPRKPRGGGAALDRELEKLYLWCVANEVPIKAHANNSIAAGPNTGTFADPAGWQRLLQDRRFRKLQLNLAHFGGFDETEPKSGLTSDSDWEETLAGMVEAFPNVYFDLGYWTEAADPKDPGRARIMARTRALLARAPNMARRMMYGSDWSMIGRVPGHPAYLAGVQKALVDLGLSESERARVMGGNAAAYLGIDRRGLQRQRLDAAYAGHPVYQDLFGS